ncbi:MAG: pitrilysin family protein [Gemmatimonadota bacterium]
METVRLDQGLTKSVAPNGLTVLTEVLPGVRSAAVGVWVRTASAHESRPKMGVSHLLEHMVFKGTERRTARQLALELEVRGGALDAYTGRDHTNYQAHVLDADLGVAVDVLTDLVRRPLLRDSDLVPERNVVLEEISTVDDTPDDLVFELFADRLWPQHPYGYSILGTRDTVAALGTEDLRAVHTSGYYPGNCVIAAAGNLGHDAVLEMLGREGWFEGAVSREPLAPVVSSAAARGREERIARDTAQTHIVFGSETFPHRDNRRFALAIVTNAFGGGMSSRLFQRIREELGLAYAIYAFQHLYQSAGVAGVYIGTQPASADAAVGAILEEFRKLAGEGLPAQELAEGKQQLKGQVMLSLESPLSRMNRLAGIVLNRDHYRPLDELLADIDAVTQDEVAALTAEYFAPERQTIIRLGP